MIKNVIVLLVITTLFSSCNFKSEKKQNKEVIKEEVVVENNYNNSLSLLANKLKLYYNNDYDKFFELFPNDFTTFNSLYGYDDKKGKSLLYSNYQTHIKYLFKEKQPDLLNKCISLGINGKWEADAISAVQNFTRDLVIIYPNKTITLLEKYSENDIFSFWNFMFDGPHPDDKQNLKIYNTIHSEVEKINKEQSELIKLAYLKIKEDSEH